MANWQGLIKQAAYVVMGFACCLQTSCIKYDDGLFVATTEYSNKILPRLNQTDIKNYPVNCRTKGLGVNKWMLDVTKNPLERRPTVLFLTNVKREPIIIDVYNPQPSASAGWMTTIDPQNWSVMNMHRKYFKFVCYLPKRGGGLRKVNCGDYLNGCWMTVRTAGKVGSGNYWIVENKLLQASYLIMQQRGFHVLPPGDL